MVIAGQHAAAIDDLAQDPADNGAQGLLHDFVIGDQAVRRLAHESQVALPGLRVKGGKG